MSNDRDPLMTRTDWIMLACGIVLVLVFGFGLMIARTAPSVAAGTSCGLASFYGSESGTRTASGARFNPSGMTAAHRTLPFGTRVRVTDIRTGRSVTVTVNDRGPARWTGRAIDLSRGAAQRLGIINRGIARVCISPIR